MIRLTIDVLFAPVWSALPMPSTIPIESAANSDKGPESPWCSEPKNVERGNGKISIRETIPVENRGGTERENQECENRNSNGPVYPKSSRPAENEACERQCCDH